MRASSLQTTSQFGVSHELNTKTIDEHMQSISRHRGRLSYVVSGLKSAVTHYARKNNNLFGWQPRFHDRIVRDYDELNHIAEYIENNVLQSQQDEYLQG